jgi:hypothetical protein
MAKRRARAKARYRVFVSHATDDVWVAGQIARGIEECGATSFLDERDIVAGEKFKERINEEMPKCDELLALFTPWSRRRAWVRHEIGMATALKMHIVCIFYKVTVADFRKDEGGLGPLDGMKTIEINAIETYFRDLRRRAG